MSRRQDGFTLIELLVGMVLMVVLTLAILAGLEGFTRAHGRTSGESEAQGAVREVIDQITRELRNGAEQSGTAPVLQRADPADLVVISPAPTGGGQLRVRYCVGTSASATGILWLQSQPWSGSGAPVAASCPDASFSSARQLTADLVPGSGASSIAPFSYDAASPAAVSRVWIALSLKAGSSGAPPALLTTGVTLRNQNRAPTASFTATPTSGYRVILDGSNSADPDDQTLTYRWADGPTGIGSVAVLDYQAASGGTHSISLTVTDPSGASATATQSVTLR